MDAAVEHHILLSENAARRVSALREREGNREIMLRVSVNGGGCSGFSYSFALDERRNADDRTFEQHGVTVVVDEVSLELLKGSTIDFVEDLVGSAFAVKNPNAASTCGCGSSFSL
jgi:iron-sulfur cluster insertion protein